MQVFAELNERGDRCNVYFRYTTELKDAIKRVPGSTFVPRDKGGPYWRLPLDLVSMRRMREEFGTGLKLGDGLKAWGREQVKTETKLRSLAVADDFPLEEMAIYKKLPALAEWLRPYQRADIAYLAAVQHGALNLNEQRLGKTPEMIGTIYEAGLEDGPHLVCAPQKSLDSVWRLELERWTDMTVFTFSGEVSDNDRARMFRQVEEHLDDGIPFVFATTPDMIRRGLPDRLELVVDWKTFIIDEFHKTGLPEVKNVFPKKAANIKAERKYGLSGTPMGGKPIKLWGALHFLYPDLFTSKWRWADQWLQVTEEAGHKKIGGVKKGREDEFYSSLAPFAVRRLRTEVLDQLPPKQYIDVWCAMTKTQRKQYDVFAAEAEIRIDEHHLSATSILAEYTRLKQFANARCGVEILGPPDEETGRVPIKVKPTYDSGKFPTLLEKLAEQGIDPEDPTGTSQAIVCSQFRETVEVVHKYLTEKGIKCALLTGKTKKAESDRIQLQFKEGHDSEGMRVVCMVTSMGVGITLNNVETVHEVDETWNPDDEEQVTDRAINTTRNHQVTVFRYRSRDSIEEYIYEVTAEKAAVNRDILDLRRQGFRSTGVK